MELKFRKAAGYRVLPNGTVQVLVPKPKKVKVRVVNSGKPKPPITIGKFKIYTYQNAGKPMYSVHDNQYREELKEFRSLAAAKNYAKSLLNKNRLVNPKRKTTVKRKTTTKRRTNPKPIKSKAKKVSDKSGWSVAAQGGGRFGIIDEYQRLRSPIKFKSRASAEKVLKVMRGMRQK